MKKLKAHQVHSVPQWSFLLSAPHERALPPADVPEFAFMGRSNVGKSSLMNALMHASSLARVSKRPGCTQALNFYHSDAKVRLVDLPGMGYAKVPAGIQRQWHRMLPFYLTKRPNLVHTYLLIDGRHEPQRIDHTALDFLRHRRCPFSVIITKIDAIPARVLDQRLEVLGTLCPHNDLFAVSARKNTGIDAVRYHISAHSTPDN